MIFMKEKGSVKPVVWSTYDWSLVDELLVRKYQLTSDRMGEGRRVKLKLQLENRSFLDEQLIG